MNFAKLVNLAMDCEVGKVVCEVGNGLAKLAKWFAKLAMGCEFGNGFAKLAKWFANLAKWFAKLAMRNFAKVQFHCPASYCFSSCFNCISFSSLCLGFSIDFWAC